MWRVWIIIYIYDQNIVWRRFEQCGELYFEILHMIRVKSRSECWAALRSWKLTWAVNGFVSSQKIGITGTQQFSKQLPSPLAWFCFILNYEFPAILAVLALSDLVSSKTRVTPEGRVRQTLKWHCAEQKPSFDAVIKYQKLGLKHLLKFCNIPRCFLSF